MRALLIVDMRPTVTVVMAAEVTFFAHLYAGRRFDFCESSISRLGTVLLLTLGLF